MLEDKRNQDIVNLPEDFVREVKEEIYFVFSFAIPTITLNLSLQKFRAKL